MQYLRVVSSHEIYKYELKSGKPFQCTKQNGFTMLTYILNTECLKLQLPGKYITRGDLYEKTYL